MRSLVFFRFNTLSFYIVILLSLLTIKISIARVYYIAKDGNSDYSTIQAGINAANMGDIIYVRSGTYHEQISINKNKLTIANQQGHQPVIDGQHNIPAGSGRVLSGMILINGNNNIFKGFEVKNSNGINIEIGGKGNLLQDLNVHHANENGIIVFYGDGTIIEDCLVWQNVLMNENGDYGTTGWSTGLSAGKNSKNTIVRRCVIYNNWGEGLSAYQADADALENNVIFEDNIVYDNWAVNVYIDNSPHMIVQRNLIYHSGDPSFSEAPSIGFCDEQNPSRSHHVKIINNLILGGNRCFYFWIEAGGAGLKDVLIAHNTFVNSTSSETIRISSGDHERTRIENNIFLEESSRQIANIPNDPSISFSHNLWSKAPSSNASSPNDVVDDPELSKIGSKSAGSLTSEWFKILSSSPANEFALKLEEVTTDYFNTLRGSNPDIGAHEYRDTNISAPINLKIEE